MFIGQDQVTCCNDSAKRATQQSNLYVGIVGAASLASNNDIGGDCIASDLYQVTGVNRSTTRVDVPALGQVANRRDVCKQDSSVELLGADKNMQQNL